MQISQRSCTQPSSVVAACRCAPSVRRYFLENCFRLTVSLSFHVRRKSGCRNFLDGNFYYNLSFLEFVSESNLPICNLWNKFLVCLVFITLLSRPDGRSRGSDSSIDETILPKPSTSRRVGVLIDDNNFRVHFRLSSVPAIRNGNDWITLRCRQSYAFYCI